MRPPGAGRGVTTTVQEPRPRHIPHPGDREPQHAGPGAQTGNQNPHIVQPTLTGRLTSETRRRTAHRPLAVVEGVHFLVNHLARQSGLQHLLTDTHTGLALAARPAITSPRSTP